MQRHTESIPTNTPHVFHVETTWKRPFLRFFNLEYTWCVCKDQLWVIFKVLSLESLI